MQLTTAMLAQLSEQDIFDIAAWRMLDQDARALNGDVCSYRAADGRRCPVGWLLSDSEYRTEFEGKRVGMLPEFANDYGCSRPFIAFLLSHEWLLNRLQHIHDHHSPYEWSFWLCEVARVRGLDSQVIGSMRAKQADKEKPLRAWPVYRAWSDSALYLAAIMLAVVLDDPVSPPSRLPSEGSESHVISESEQPCEAEPA